MPITTENELLANLRFQLETLNNFKFTNAEWEQFFKNKIANQNIGIEEKTTIIQEDYIQLLTREDGTVKNIFLIDKAMHPSKQMNAYPISSKVYHSGPFSKEILTPQGPRLLSEEQPLTLPRQSNYGYKKKPDDNKGTFGETVNRGQ